MRKHVTVKNGNIAGGVTYTNGSQVTFSGPGFLHGVFVVDSGTKLVRVIDVSVSGVAGHGIYAGFNTSTAERCSVDTALTAGISAVTVSHSNASGIGGAAIEAHAASDCTGISLNGPGVSSRVATNCHGTGVAAPGVVATTVSNCVGVSETYRGISASNVANSNGYSGSGLGIYADTVVASTGRSTDTSAVFTKVALASYGNSTDNHGIVSSVATGSVGESAHRIGIYTQVAGDCYGESASNADVTASSYPVLPGIHSSVIANSKGRATGTGDGIDCVVATGVEGITTVGRSGVRATVALNSYGHAHAIPTTIEQKAIDSPLTLNCWGEGSTYGIWGTNSMNSYGSSHNGQRGIALGGVASYCYGIGDNAIESSIAVGCWRQNVFQNIISPSKHLGTP